MRNLIGIRKSAFVYCFMILFGINERDKNRGDSPKDPLKAHFLPVIGICRELIEKKWPLRGAQLTKNWPTSGLPTNRRICALVTRSLIQ